MTQEEKAKAYDEALERARIWKDKSGMPADKQGILDDIFPELKESEDEKLRKDLLQIAKESEDSFYMVMTPDKREQLIAWLEKQDPKKHEEELEKAYKTADKVQYRRGYEAATKEMEKQGEQKPTWSEVDEEKLSDAIFFVREYQIPTRDKRLLNAAKETEDWLKSLKERIGGLTDFDVIGEVVQRNLLEEVVKQMSDTLLIETLLYRKKQGTLSIFYGERKEGLERFLKSICTWKPSDEQIGVIESLINNRPCKRKHLDSLYNDLKKLREDK